MENEEKKEAAPASEVVTEEVVITEPEADSGESETDYKAELEKVKSQLSKAEHKLTQKDKEERRKKKEAEEFEADPLEVDEDEEEEPRDKEEDLSTLRKENEKFKLDFIADTVSEEINSLSANQDERALIKHFYENRIVRSGYTRSQIREDLQAAYLLANKRRFVKRSGEIVKALEAERGKTKSPQSAGQKTQEEDTVVLSPLERKLLSRYGLTEKDIKK